MVKTTLTLLVFILPAIVFAQEVIGFKFGQTSYRELDVKTYPADTSANAYVMNEFGEAHIAYDNPGTLIFRHHIKIKILRQEGLKQADVEIVLGKNASKEETITDIRASSFNVAGKSGIEETKVEYRAIFTEKNDESYNRVKFAIPNAKVGSVIEYQYQIRSPFIWNFKEWEFQSEIPKVISEYQSTIPAYYIYNVTLRGYLSLASRQSETLRECLTISGTVADCAVEKYVMKDVPAFKEEEYMTAKKNFLSAIRFELQQIRYPNGSVEKFTKEWKDADMELRDNPKFGTQLKRGKDVVDEHVDVAVLGEPDPLAKAKKIYDLIKFHYIWNEYYGKESDLGIKKAFDQKKGNVGDINLTLIAALRYAGFNVDPVLIGTRGLGRPGEIYPVLSDFNYVIAKLDLDGKTYLLDAVDDFMPFGSISSLCYNGIGRVINADGSYWMDIKPTDKYRTVTMINLKLSGEGKMTGTISQSYSGYAALRKRKQVASFQDEKTYLAEEQASNHFMTFTSYERVGENDLSKSMTEKFGVEFTAFDQGVDHFLFNPFIVDRTETNPFKSDTRMFPVDFAVPQDESITIVIEFPENFEVMSTPDKVGLALPNAGGRYVFGATITGNKLTVVHNLGISRTVFNPEEYPYLKEIYSKMLQAQGTDVIFQRKK